MKSPTVKVQDLLSALIKYHGKVFQTSKAATPSMPETAPDPDAQAFYIESQKERDVFRDFHEHHSTSTLEESPCQCTLFDQAHKHIQEQKMPTDEHDFRCDCGKPLKASVPKTTHPEAMVYDVHQDLLN